MFPNGAGIGKGSGGTLVNPSWKIDSVRQRQHFINFVPGVSTFAFSSPGERYELDGRFRYYKNKVGRDRVYDSNWVYIDSTYSGGGL